MSVEDPKDIQKESSSSSQLVTRRSSSQASQSPAPSEHGDPGDKDEDLKPVCSTCDQTFKSNLSYTRHVNKCKGKHLTYQKCDHIFENIDSPRQHMVDDHTKELFPSMFEGCYSSFNTKKGITCHEGAHSKKKLSCSPCNQEFETSNDLKNHNRTSAHKDKVKKNPCKGCGNIFNGKSAANRHFENYCPFNADRKVRCIVCKITTGKASEFLKHLQEKHASTNEHFCTRCLVEFPSEKKLKEHQEKCSKGG